MQFTKYLRDGVRSGAITRTVRIWMRPKVKAGKRYTFHGGGEIEIDSIEQISLDDITPRLARACGFEDAESLLKIAKHGRGANVYLIDFHYIAPRV